MSIVFTNNSSTTLASAILYTDVSFTVATGTGSTFPAIGGGDVAYITLTDGSTLEIVKVTGRSGDIFTCVRGQDGTTAAPWAAGTTVQLRTTAAALTGMMQKANNLSDLANAGNARTNLGVAIGSNVQAWDADLDAIAALTGTLGVLRKTAANTWTLDTTVLSSSGLTNNGVLYSNGVGQVVNGTALTFDGTTFKTSAAGTSVLLSQSTSNGSVAISRVSGLNASATALIFDSGVNLVTANAYELYDRQNSQQVDTYVTGSGGYRALFINGSEQMRLTSTGLGIGTSTVAGRLTLRESSGSPTALVMLNRNATQQWAIAVDAAAVDDKILAFIDQTAGAVRMSLDISGNLGLGVTPSAWNAGNTALQIANGAAFGGLSGGYTVIGQNYYGAASVDKYIAALPASRLYLYQNSFTWQQAGTGTVGGTIAWTSAMTLDGNGNLGLGTTSPNASAILDAQSTTKGVRFPNMTTTQKNAVSSPAAGLVVFDTTLAKLCVYSGSAWQTITSI
jgi:hypothetical protein